MPSTGACGTYSYVPDTISCSPVTVGYAYHLAIIYRRGGIELPDVVLIDSVTQSFATARHFPAPAYPPLCFKPVFL